MKEMKCKKCGNDSYFTQVKGNNKGAYCCKCGAWIKWLNKDERNLDEIADYFQKISSIRCTTEIERELVNNHVQNISKPTSVKFNDATIIERLERFVDALDEGIDSVYEHHTCNHDQIIYNNTYAYALEKCKASIQNIINGREYNDGGTEQ